LPMVPPGAETRRKIASVLQALELLPAESHQ